ncbi:chemotaxis protein CheX [Suilimivivens sp.]|uniref:chemotaxis protein CheX n=1 Tax=Suilimivivens sp. TaxID=2981669 RepID=UPI003078919B
MVSSRVGTYRMEKGLLTGEQFRHILNEQQKVRVKLGLIAVAEGLMTQEEADRVNQLQAVMDRRFGDIAVEKGYLTEGQVNSLLKKQGNAYLAFAQAMENQQLMTIEQLEQILLDYRCENNFTASDMDALKSDDVDSILPLFLPVDSEAYYGIAGTAVRTLMRLVDTGLYPDKAYIMQKTEDENGALQKVEGEKGFVSALGGKGNALQFTASVFGQEKFASVDEDALDAIGELLNCINGLYVSECKDGSSLELMPPSFKTGIQGFESRKMLVLPIHIKNDCVDLMIAIGDEIEMK